MNSVFRQHLHKFVLVFFDDILVYSRTWQEHLEHVRIIFDLLQQHRLFVKKKKCEFGREELEYLGHIISAAGVKVDQSKIKAMVDWPPLTTVTELRGFLGLTGYYQKFVENYGIIARPLTNLLKKGKLEWTAPAETAFEALKTAMTSTPTLALPDFSMPFLIQADASGDATRKADRFHEQSSWRRKAKLVYLCSGNACYRDCHSYMEAIPHRSQIHHSDRSEEVSFCP